MGRAEQKKARQFFVAMRDAELDPVYLFHGPERYLVDRATEAVQRRIFGDEEPDPFRYDSLHGSDADGRKIVDAARTMSMMGGQRLVLVREIDKLDESELELVVGYAEKPAKRSVVVLTASKIDGRKALWKKLKKASHDVAFEQLYKDQMPAWIQRQGRQKKLRVDDDAAEYLAEAVGTDMALLDANLEKLLLLNGPGSTVDVPAVRLVVAETRERTVFELTDALSTRDLNAVLRASQSLKEHGEEPIRVVVMIARHVRMLLKCHSGMARKLRDQDLARFVGVSKFFLRDYVRGARHFTVPRLLELHELLYESDRALKSSRVPNDLLLERLLTAFCLGESTAAPERRARR